MRAGKTKLVILFEDDEIIVCEKEAGIATQSNHIGEKDMISLIKSYLFEKNIRNGEPYLGVIHRLDQPVSGIIVFAKNPIAARNLSRQITEHKMKKKYLAVTEGPIFHKEGTLEDYIVKSPTDNLSYISNSSNPEAKKSALNYKIISQNKGQNLVEVNLITGRHHQIRVQFAHIESPLYGDTKYNSRFVNRKGWYEIALCAYRLEFKHPKTEKTMEFVVTPKGDAFSAFVDDFPIN